MVYDVNNCDLPRTRRANSKPPKSMYKNKVQNKEKHHQNNKTEKERLQVDAHTKKGMIPPLMVTVAK